MSPGTHGATQMMMFVLLVLCPSNHSPSTIHHLVTRNTNLHEGFFPFIRLVLPSPRTSSIIHPPRTPFPRLSIVVPTGLNLCEDQTSSTPAVYFPRVRCPHRL
ncbi:hypothetical protein E2C01_065503 [Portunus trituberculatus]|uniref:Secreted protein n=1 Tax=Portunus trituberculatus TaxID=210409 RepID=A0A5B7HER8_PORTR|nr:hypothetical protein [Portunus trituberculatus]